ncbi:hypothetical protein LMANV2_290021 [Leptospira interrogans serovar Manilae]|uniref:Uncharacterized protein n=1 Tax=Leptospira interrogans serovar Manilae TaxID=214675 RepID=A0AAQ1P023_LEPIR|nr:hypothetical protein LMANV2_290021 [Leptospira interrogans serovar Manilae]
MNIQHILYNLLTLKVYNLKVRTLCANCEDCVRTLKITLTDLYDKTA